MPHFAEQPQLPDRLTKELGAQHHERLRRLVAGIWAEDTTTNHQLRLYPERYLDWHATIFAPWRSRGEFRGKTETVLYFLSVNGKKVRRFGEKGGRKLANRVERVCSDFSRAAGPRPFDPALGKAERVDAAAAVYVETLRAHPFLYGNCAIAFLALHTAYKRLGLSLSVPLRANPDFDQALAKALHQRGAEARRPLVEVMLQGNGKTPVEIVPRTPKRSGRGLRHPDTITSEAAAALAGDSLTAPATDD